MLITGWFAVVMNRTKWWMAEWSQEPHTIAKGTSHAKVPIWFMPSISCITCTQQYAGQTKRTVLKHFEGHYANINKALRHMGKNAQGNPKSHPYQLQGDTIGLHFAQASHKGTTNLKIHVLESIPFPANSERSWNWDSKRRNSGYIGSYAQPHKDWPSWSKIVV